jgi:DnaJ-class molecular chaperone
VLDVTIPPGTRDGQILRLRGKGRPGIGGGPPGDALIEIEVRPHHVFTRKGDDIHAELPISLKEAVLGGKVKVPTPSGAVTMTVPKWSNTGTVLRLKGQGVPKPGGGRGDEYVTLKVMLPERPGAIAGVLGSYMRLFPLARVVVLVPVIFVPLFFEVYAFVFVGLWFLLQVLQGTVDLLLSSRGGGVAWWAHIGGFVAGLVLCPLLVQSERRYRAYYPDEGVLGFNIAGRP